MVKIVSVVCVKCGYELQPHTPMQFLHDVVFIMKWLQTVGVISVRRRQRVTLKID